MLEFNLLNVVKACTVSINSFCDLKSVENQLSLLGILNRTFSRFGRKEIPVLIIVVIVTMSKYNNLILKNYYLGLLHIFFLL